MECIDLGDPMHATANDMKESKNDIGSTVITDRTDAEYSDLYGHSWKKNYFNRKNFESAVNNFTSIGREISLKIGDKIGFHNRKTNKKGKHDMMITKNKLQIITS